MDPRKKKERYGRMYLQLQSLLAKPGDLESRMSTIVAVLHHHMKEFSWTGFYRLRRGRLSVLTYQGPLACQVLKKNTGVCWSAVNNAKTVVVPDVHKFPGHIACDARSQSEIVIPLINSKGKVIAVLDIDSTQLSTFDDTDARELEKILSLLAG